MPSACFAAGPEVPVDLQCLKAALVWLGQGQAGKHIRGRAAMFKAYATLCAVLGAGKTCCQEGSA